MLKNEELIRRFIKDFSLIQLRYIKGVSIAVETNINFEPHTVVEIQFITKKIEQYLEISMRFVDVLEFQLSFVSSLIQVSLDIVDIKDDGWERKDYLVRDLENEEDFKFYCNSIEIKSVKLADYVHPNW